MVEEERQANLRPLEELDPTTAKWGLVTFSVLFVVSCFFCDPVLTFAERVVGDGSTVDEAYMPEDGSMWGFSFREFRSDDDMPIKTSFRQTMGVSISGRKIYAPAKLFSRLRNVRYHGDHIFLLARLESKWGDKRSFKGYLPSLWGDVGLYVLLFLVCFTAGFALVYPVFQVDEGSVTWSDTFRMRRFYDDASVILAYYGTAVLMLLNVVLWYQGTTLGVLITSLIACLCCALLAKIISKTRTTSYRALWSKLLIAGLPLSLNFFFLEALVRVRYG